jgi:uncharacterized protein (DUF1800 family)
MSTAASRYRARPYPSTSVPSVGQRHALNRLGCGFSRGTFRQLLDAGGRSRWLARQLGQPSATAESATAKALGAWFPDRDDPPSAKWAANAAGTKGGWQYAADFASWSMLRRIYSTRQVLENMVGFWSDHLHVNANHDTAWVHRTSYDATIRAHALGRFSDLLVACELHPAMLLYLDNYKSVRGAPNENQGRELLELHTVGRASGYTEAMVKDSARILSGYTVDAYKSWDGHYDANRHTTGAVQVLGFTDPNASSDGRQLAVDYLRYLAHHPATARTIATKLCRHLVADQPPTSLVNAVAKAFRDSGTDIAATLRALVAHPAFDASHGLLVRNPVEDLVATCRALQVDVHRPRSDQSFARACVWVPQTTLLYQWPRPDGAPLGDAAWSSPTRMLSSFRMHWNLTAGWWPTKDVTYRKSGAAWLPRSRIRLDQWVDHLCRVILGKPSDARLLRAVVTATGYPPATVVTKDHQLAGWLFVHLVGTLLDSPDHMRR